jgi:sugar phosphate isomerase/epimerase
LTTLKRGPTLPEDMQNGIQLYTLRELDVPMPDLLERVADAGFAGVEFAYRVLEEDPEMVATALDANDLSVLGAHVRMEDLEDDLEGTVQLYRDLQCERLIVPYLDSDNFQSAERIEGVARKLDALAEELAKYDYPLLYHNHDAEFTQLGDRTAFDVLVEQTEVVDFELDVGLATYAGADVPSVIETHGDRIDLLHCTDAHLDADGPVHASFGIGDVDYEAVFEAADATDIDWYLYENGSHDDPEGELAHAKASFIGRDF